MDYRHAIFDFDHYCVKHGDYFGCDAFILQLEADFTAILFLVHALVELGTLR